MVITINDLPWVALFSAVLVFARAWQQQNVIHGYFGWAIATSYALAIYEVFVVASVAKVGLTAIPYVGTGGAVGVVMAMLTHKRMRGE